MQNFLIYWLLFAAIALGFLLGRYSRQLPSLPPLKKSDASISPEYIRGLNHLLNEDADAAVDTFSELIPVNSSTLETHLALGALLRRRGEVGRAIRVHQHLASNKSLSPLDQQQVLLELGLDYYKAGMLDRAEEIFHQLQTATDEAVSLKSLGYLAEIYRDEQEWRKAIAVIDAILRKKLPENSQKWRAMQAHFYCEEADRAMLVGDFVEAHKVLSKGYLADSSCARVSILLAELELQRQQYRAALRYLKRVPAQDPEYIPEILPGLLHSFQELDAVEEMIDYLMQLQDEYPSSSVLLSLVDQVKHYESESAAVDLLRQKLHTKPSLRVIGKLLDFQWSKRSREESVREQDLVRSLLDLLVHHKSYYRCGACGFSGNQLHWQCPSCKSWGAVKAVRGLEGE